MEKKYKCLVCLKPRPFPIVHLSCQKHITIEITQKNNGDSIPIIHPHGHF